MEMMRALDKVQKKTEEELVEEYAARVSSGEALSELLKFGRTRGSPDMVCKRLEELRLASTGEAAGSSPCATPSGRGGSRASSTT